MNRHSLSSPFPIDNLNSIHIFFQTILTPNHHINSTFQSFWPIDVTSIFRFPHHVTFSLFYNLNWHNKNYTYIFLPCLFHFRGLYCYSWTSNCPICCLKSSRPFLRVSFTDPFAIFKPRQKVCFLSDNLVSKFLSLQNCFIIILI